MRKRFFEVLVCCLVFFTIYNLYSYDRRSSAPYISGDTFRAYVDFIIDETNSSFFPEKVTSGSTIFVKTDYLEHFFNQIHPLIASPYILISHNSDYPIPNGFAHKLDDEKLIAWFGQNVENYSHSKLHSIPIGIGNRYWQHGNIDVFDEVRSKLVDFTKKNQLYMNFSISTYYQERSLVHEHFVRQPFCFYSPPKDFLFYLMDLKKCKFVLSPRGNGLDCHRTWEALYMGAFPIVRTSALDPMYEGLPVIIVSDWNEVTESFLEQKYEEMKNKEYAWEKLDANFWFNFIDSYKIGHK